MEVEVDNRRRSSLAKEVTRSVAGTSKASKRVRSPVQESTSPTEQVPQQKRRRASEGSIPSCSSPLLERVSPSPGSGNAQSPVRAGSG